MLQIANLRPWEKIEIVLKRHWIVYAILIVYFLLWVFLSAVIWGTFWFHPFFNLLIICFWMGFSLFLFIEWLNHELDMFVISNNRIIWVEQISFLNRNVSECNLGQVQDVSSLTKWFFANILNYWTVTIQTAGNASNFLMDFCPKPLDNARSILNIVDNYRDKHGGSKSLDGLKVQETPHHSNHPEAHH